MEASRITSSIASLFCKACGLAFLWAILLHVLAVFDVYRANSAILTILFWSCFVLAAPLLVYDRLGKPRLPLPWGSWAWWRSGPLKLAMSLAVLLAYAFWFQLRHGGPRRWSIPEDPVPPLIGEKSTLVSAWVFAFVGVWHYLESKRPRREPF